MVHGKFEPALFHQTLTKVPTDWPGLGLVGSLGRRRAWDESERIAVLLGAYNTAWVTEALGRVMPEEYPGQHVSTAKDMSRNWASQAGVIVQLFLLSNNFALSDQGPYCELHDQQVSALVDQVMTTGSSKDLERILCAPGFVGEAIKSQVFSWAIRQGRHEIVRLLLSVGGCDPDPDTTYVCRWRGPNSLQAAAFIQDKRASARMIRTLLEYGAKVDNSLVYSALNIAIFMDNQEATQLLMEAGACLCLPSLAAAIRAGNDEMVRTVLDAGVVDMINDQIPSAALWGMFEWAALAHATHRGHVQIVKTLLARGADVTAVHRWSIFRGMYYHEDMQPWTTALGIAVAEEQVETAEFLAHHQHVSKGVEKLPPGGGTYVCPLIIACLVGNGEIIKALVEVGVADVSRADILPAGLRMIIEESRWQSFHSPETLLDLLITNFKGSEEQLAELCEMLIHRGACTDKALVAAVEEGRADVAGLLLRHGASPDTLSSGTRISALGLAIQMGSLNLTRILLQAGATDIGNLWKIKGGVEMAELLSGAGLLNVILREHGYVILAEAIRDEGGSQWLVDLILKTELDFTSKYTGVLVAAIERGLDIGFINGMIGRGAGWTTVNLSPAIEAAIKADAPDDIMHSLLPAYMRIEKDSNGSFLWWERLRGTLFCVARHGSIRMLGIILKAVDWKPRDLGVALSKAISSANYRVIRGFLDAGASLSGDVDCPWLPTPLDSAVVAEQAWLVKLLLSSGANVHDHGALASAARVGNIGLVEILLDAGASPNGPAGTGRGDATALQIASHKGFLGIVRNLIDAGADVNAWGRLYNDATSEQYGLELTALTLAASGGRLETLHFLLSRGAAIHGVTGRGQFVDAVRAATLNSHRAATALLKEYGGWTELDEQALRAKHMAAVAAAKAKQDIASRSASFVTLNGTQECDRDDRTISNELLKELPCNEILDWPQDWAEEEGGTGSGAMHGEFSDFFLEELSRLQGYTMDDDC